MLRGLSERYAESGLGSEGRGGRRFGLFVVVDGLLMMWPWFCLTQSY